MIVRSSSLLACYDCAQAQCLSELQATTVTGSLPLAAGSAGGQARRLGYISDFSEWP